MAVLSSKGRKKLPQSKFALPGKKYPIQDKAHAGNAKARASQAYNAGKITAGQKAMIFKKANRVLGNSAIKSKKK